MRPTDAVVEWPQIRTASAGCFDVGSVGSGYSPAPVTTSSAMQPRDRAGERLGVEQALRRAARRDLRIDRHREHDRAIAVVDDERGGDRLAGRVVEAREPHAAVLAELERDVLEQRRRFVVGERRRLVALGPLEARQPAQRAHALAQRDRGRRRTS